MALPRYRVLEKPRDGTPLTHDRCTVQEKEAPDIDDRWRAGAVN